MRNRTIAALLVVVILVGAGAGYFIGVNGAPNTSSFGTSFNTTFTTYFHYSISINYSGSWNLVYWGQNGTQYNDSIIPGCACLAGYNFKGNLNGSGNYEARMTTYGVGYVENTFCAKATKLDSQNLTLTLTVVYQTKSTTNSNPSAEVCAAMAA